MTHVHLVGSVNLSDHETVIRSVSEQAGEGVLRISDGEVGRPFVTWFMPVVMQHPALGVEKNETIPLLPRLVVSDDFDEQLEFEDLGFAKAALASYALFADLKAQGAVAEETRFQVGFPSAFTLACPIASIPDQERFAEAFLRVLLREIEAVVDGIPHDQLAIQIEMPGEVGILEGVFPAWFGTDTRPIAEQFARFAAAVPLGVHLGFHLCYGDPPPEEGARGEHWAQPVDTGVLVGLANAVVDGAGRPLQWVHMPVPIDRDDEAYFRPLTELRLPAETELFLGLVHDIDGIEGTKRRIDAARPFRAQFGVATECGMGRVPEDQTIELLRLHREAAAAVEGAVA